MPRGVTLKNCRLLFLLLFASIVSGCGGDKELIVEDVVDAESIVVTNAGRVFVSGSTNIYEVIKKQDGSYLKLKLFDRAQRCEVGGISLIQNGDYLYAHCTTSHTKVKSSESLLLAAKIVEPQPTEYDVDRNALHPSMEVEVVTTLKNLLLPAGMAVDGSGNLYLADTGKNAIFQITFATPTIVSSIEKWNQTPIHSVSGLEWINNNLYYTAMKEGSLIATLGYVTRNPDGSAGQSSTVYERAYTVFDDITPFQQGIVITDYLKGSLIYWKDGKVAAETARDSFLAPSAVAIGRSPLFSESDLLVTEKGVLLDDNPSVGNRLSRATATF